jgi:hypothetical protein
MIVITDKIPMITKVHTVASAISLVVMFFNDSLIFLDDYISAPLLSIGQNY